ncbi:Pcc1-domain-containing protein [Daldinia caldariorum]|uniref:Pcc1-domain-containing protein n=1 Tax=Daldinia caldariorum TaxID=326644 RepID=UPI0020074F1E|nr:Pcc1-domain-containing protein [Daldinia caldariorum]KAI1468765.1 Pcc1-domain-containing protein [Daldinia caldariorum]
MASTAAEIQYPCALTIEVPFPTPRLASIALKALQVDKELSPLVKRTFSIGQSNEDTSSGDIGRNILRTEYKATTNRMLRVAVNSFMDSLNLVIEVMQELDTDVLETEDTKA